MDSSLFLQPYQINWKLHGFLSLVLYLIVVLLRGQGLILQLPRPALMATALLLVFQVFCFLSQKLAENFKKKFDSEYPSLILWLYPTLVLLKLAFFSFALISLSNYFYGRGYWSYVLQLNGQETTRFFSTSFAAMIAFTAGHFLFATISAVWWIAQSSKSRVEQLNQAPEINPANACKHLNEKIDRLRAETEIIQAHRRRASTVNRRALILLAAFLSGGSCWIIFFRPAIVLYYRAELQLKTQIEPMAAYATLEHLCQKYPGYRYIDSVKFRMAWILDRRLQRHEKAAESYSTFIEKYAPGSTWSDEAYAALVRLYSDKLNRPDQALKFSKEYLNLYAGGIFAPHMHLYRIRAFMRQGDVVSAKAEKAQALQKFAGKMMQITSQEDLLIELISFNDAIKAEVSAFPELQ